MPDRITLTLPPGIGGQRIEIDVRRFSIGRIPGNDLVIDDPSLSRRHALIENFDGRLYVSDCGSSNGTFVNGAPVAGGTELHDGDELTFGGVGNILVNVRTDQSQAQGTAQPATAGAASLNSPGRAAAGYTPGAASGTFGTQAWPSAPLMAAAAVVVILLVAGLILILANSGTSSGGPSKPIVVKRQTPVPDNDNAGDTTPSQNNSSNLASQTTPDPDVSPGANNNPDPGSVELSMLESYAGKVLSEISKDRQPVLNEKAVREINARVLRYRGSSSLAEQLRAMKRNLPQVSATAKANRVKTPLAVYATLARIDKDGSGDAVQTAAQLCPVLQRLLGLFGQELANDTLLAVAALEEGPGLQLRLTKLAGRSNDSPTTIRSIWFLHEHQAISDKTYDFLLRFLAIGVIAQDPQKFGVAAEPLVF